MRLQDHLHYGVPDPADFPAQESFEAQMRFLLCYAVRAPSGHNTQPWRFAIGPAWVDVFADRNRTLPVVDPEGRELVISCGAAIGMFAAAARYFGFATEVLAPADMEDRDAVARLLVHHGETPDPEVNSVFDAIAKRITDRAAYHAEPVPEALVRRLAMLTEQYGVTLSPSADAAGRAAVARLVAAGDRVQFRDPRFRRELAIWVRSRRSGHADGMSGAAFGMPDVTTPIGRVLIRTIDMGDDLAQRDTKKIEAASPLLLLLSTPGDGQGDWIAAGQALAHVSLVLTAEGWRLSYLNQPIEVAALRRRLATAFGTTQDPQILLRVGRSEAEIPVSVRRPVDDVIIA